MSSLETTPTKLVTVSIFAAFCFFLAKVSTSNRDPHMPGRVAAPTLNLPIVEKSLPSATPIENPSPTEVEESVVEESWD